MESTATSTIYKIDEIDFTTFIDNLWNIDKYYQVYISIGGKWNQSKITFTNPHNSLPIHFPSNACHQMIPRFMQNLNSTHPDKENSIRSHILVIVLDQFNSEETIQKNSEIISRSFSYSEVLYDVVLLNSRISIQKNKLSIEPIMEKIVGLAQKYSIPAKNFMICNYVMFLHPNEPEYKLEENIPMYIQRFLGKDLGPYSDRFYQWYGPHFHLHQLVYQYSEYFSQRMVYHNELTNMWKMCERTPYSMPICEDTAYLLIDEVKRMYDSRNCKGGSPKRLENAMRKLDLFFRTHLDISSTNMDSLVTLTQFGEDEDPYIESGSDEDYVDVRLGSTNALDANLAAF
jgi:hypothetical protein